ncbi:MAG: hypothetical protein J7L73_07955 [Anaerolineales bacterium]|nr:hypothetical protein [Anaerolineales bacterium]
MFYLRILQPCLGPPQISPNGGTPLQVKIRVNFLASKDAYLLKFWQERAEYIMGCLIRLDVAFYLVDVQRI